MAVPAKNVYLWALNALSPTSGVRKNHVAPFLCNRLILRHQAAITGGFAMSIMFHDGNRQLQDRFDSRRISDRLEEKLTRTAFSEDDKAFIESAAYFFIATADAEGRPDCSFKGGLPGFVRVTDAAELAFPDYDGNGMFKSLGNVLTNPHVGLLFIAMHGKPKRLRINGSARVSDNDPLLGESVGAQLIVRVQARAIFPNCPRYIPDMQMAGPSIYTPQPKCDPPEPAWKGFDSFKDAVHPRAPAWKG
jgi:predicted pyridoxine 5'-phosphate oxidase superfamily flavin-nucleotide-binding protein